MVWSHCESDEILDDARCPSCGMTKAEWTIKVGHTRVFKIGKRKKNKAATWIELDLVDAEGNPLAEELSFTLDLPDGRRESGSFAQGSARVEGIPAGACFVTIAGLRPRPADAPEPAPADSPLLLVADPQPDDESGFECAAGQRHTLRRCHWIELRVKDDFGFPLADEPFRIEFEDGTPARDSTLDGEGYARVDGLLRAGPCVVTFPKRQIGELTLASNES